MQVILELDGGGPVFCGVVGKSHSRKGERAGLCVPRRQGLGAACWIGKEEAFFPEAGTEL